MYKLDNLIKLINLPKGYLGLAIKLLKDKTKKYKVLNTLYNNKKDFIVINNTREKDLNGYAKITGCPVEFLEFDLSLQGILETELIINNNKQTK